MADTAESLIDSYSYGKITFDQLVEKFSKLPMSAPRSLRPGRTWADVYREAEEGDDSDIRTPCTRRNSPARSRGRRKHSCWRFTGSASRLERRV
jgi:hypothetical protein